MSQVLADSGHGTRSALILPGVRFRPKADTHRQKKAPTGGALFCLVFGSYVMDRMWAATAWIKVRHLTARLEVPPTECQMLWVFEGVAGVPALALILIIGKKPHKDLVAPSGELGG